MSEDEPGDLELNPPPDRADREVPSAWPGPTTESRGAGLGLWLTGAVLALLLVGTGVWLLRARPRSNAPPLPMAKAAPTTTGPTPASLVLPSLEGSDATVRDLLRGLSSHPLFAVWLSRRDLVRMLAVVVVNVADGESPRPHLPFLAPRSPFSVVERRSGRLLVDPVSYARYDAVGDAAQSLDPVECARVFRLLEPLFEAAYRELGHPEGGFSRKLGTALVKLLEVPVVEGEVPLVRIEKAVVVYEFFDEKLEALTPPQKHLLRMGPRNVKRIQERLRGLGDALSLSSSSPPATPASPASRP